MLNGGGDSHDNAVYRESHRGVRVDLAAGTARGDGRDTLLNVEWVYGSPHHDVLVGNGGANYLSGEDGNDYLWGLRGGDVLTGGRGSDHLHGGQGSDDCAQGETETSCET